MIFPRPDWRSLAASSVSAELGGPVTPPVTLSAAPGMLAWAGSIAGSWALLIVLRGHAGGGVASSSSIWKQSRRWNHARWFDISRRFCSEAGKGPRLEGGGKAPTLSLISQLGLALKPNRVCCSPVDDCNHSTTASLHVELHWNHDGSIRTVSLTRRGHCPTLSRKTESI